MSYCVRIRTKNLPTPEEVFKAMAEKGEQLVVTSPDYPCAKVGNHYKALRGIELNEEENGVEVRVCSFGSAEDYRLFGKTVKTVMDLTGGRAFVSDDDEEEVTDPLSQFGEEWVAEQRESCFGMLKLFSLKYGNRITLYGLFAQICIGPHLFKGFGIDMDTENTPEVIDRLQDYLVSVQWHLAGKDNTSTRMVMPDPSDPEAEGKTISMISISKGKVNKFDYISNADILGIMDMDHEDVRPVLIPFEKITKILPAEGFRILDEYQFERTGKITPGIVRQMMEDARIYQPDDLMHKPVDPGDGYDETQNTVILTWNPGVSSVKLEDHNATIPDMFTEYYNWSVWEHDKAKCGDRFFMVRVGDGNTGIVMSGVFDSHPYESGDWKGKGRRTFYMDMVPNVILDPDKAPMLTTAELEKAIPGFQWTGGHSGRILPPDDARKLEKLWHEYLRKNHEAIDGKTMNAASQFERMD